MSEQMPTICQSCKFPTEEKQLNECDYCEDKDLLYCNICINSDGCNVFCNSHIFNTNSVKEFQKQTDENAMRFINKMSELNEVCPCSSACDPKNYIGRTMLYPDEAWHNWFLSTPENKLDTVTEWKPNE